MTATQLHADRARCATIIAGRIRHLHRNKCGLRSRNGIHGFLRFE